MSAENVRAVLFRILTDSDFYNLMLVNPEEALKGYDLTNDERRILAASGKDLYKTLGGAETASFDISLFFLGIPTLAPSSPLLKENDEKFVQLVNSIQNAVGQERFANIMQLVEKMQENQKIESDPPQND